jgi:Carboxypeptidase regulatory-like domain
MASLRGHGAVGVREVRTGKSGSVSNVGDLKVGVGHTLSGTVVLADGKPVPAGTGVMLFREEAWDSQQARVDDEGRFVLTGLPAERYQLSTNVRGYDPSAKNASLDPFTPYRLVGVIREDIEGLRLLLEPGPRPERRPDSDTKTIAEWNRRRDAPLRGAPVDAN